MNSIQKDFLNHLAQIQESCVQICMVEHKNNSKEIESMLYDVTYSVITEIMELLDGCSSMEESKYDVIHIATGQHLKENPSIELHDQTEDFLRCQ